MDYKNNSSAIGAIGEAVAIYECEKRNISVSLPFSENSPYDMILDANGKLYRMQVKTTKNVKPNGTMEFVTCRTNGFTGERTPYSSDEIDLMFLYCIENGFRTIIGPEIFEGKGELIFRIEPPKNNQISKVKMVEDYDLRNDNNLLPLLHINDE